MSANDFFMQNIEAKLRKWEALSFELKKSPIPEIIIIGRLSTSLTLLSHGEVQNGECSCKC